MAVKRATFAAVFVGLLAVCLVIIFAQRRQNPTTQTRARRANSELSTATLRSGADLQSAIDKASYGETLVLEAGGVFKGPVVLRNKGGAAGTASYITIRTANLSGLPAAGERVNPQLHAAAMPKIIAPDGSVAIATEPGAHHYKFVGIEFSPSPDGKYLYNLIDLGAPDYKSGDQFPHHLVFDRVYVHSTGLNKARRGFALNSGLTSICDSYIAGFAGAGDETQGIVGWNGPGPFNIINNYIEGGAQGIMFGGADPSIPNLVPSDIQIRNNTIFKPAAWFGKATIKASIELKSARKIVIDGNVIDSGDRIGAFVLTVRNQEGKANWSTIEDLEITNNIVRNAGNGFTILGRDDINVSQEAKRIRVANNLMTGMGPDHSAMFIKISGGDGITFENNTIQHTGNIITSYSEPTRRFVFRNNIIQYNEYGIYCERGPEMLSCFPGAVFTGNVIVDNRNLAAQGFLIGQNYPRGNFFPPSFDRLGFVDYRGGDWKLKANSPLKRKATDGGDLGVRFDELETAQSNKPICSE